MALGSRLFRLLLLCYLMMRPARCSKFRESSSGEYSVDWQAMYMSASREELLFTLEEASG